MLQPGVIDRIVSSRVNYFGGWLGDIAAISFFLFYGLAHVSSSVPACIASGLAGLVLWSLVEYLMHRFVFHGPKSAAKHGHTRHHQRPEALVGSPMLSLVAFIFLFWFLLSLVIPTDIASFMAMTFTVGHLYFAVLHHVMHHWEGRARIFVRLQHYHEIHHRLPRANYGSTTLFWDRVFGTFDSGESLRGAKISPERSGRNSGSR